MIAYKTRKDIKIKTNIKLYIVFIAELSALILPYIVHFVGRLTGVGSIYGKMLLPMHLPIILVGFLSGPLCGSISGILAPLINYLLIGMPNNSEVLFMMIELSAYGTVAGIIKEYKWNMFLKVLFVQLSGRICKVIATVFLNNVLNYKIVELSSIFLTIKNGVYGIALQLIIVPLFIRLIKKDDVHG